MKFLSFYKTTYWCFNSEKAIFYAVNICTIKKIFPHLQSKQTDKFFIVKV